MSALAPTPPAIATREVAARPLRAIGLELGYRDRRIVHGIDLDFEPGLVTTIVGANGCGKSTLLRGLAGLLQPSAGAVELLGAPLASLSPKRVATRLALLPQSPIAPEGMTVAELVARGRQPHQSWFQQWRSDDERVVRDALEATDLLPLAERPLTELSGGQRQRAWIALVLAQDAPVVLLDEPTTHLDLAHAVDVMRLVRDLAHERGRTVVTVLHDLALAARASDRLVVLREGRELATGAPADVLSEELLLEAFGLRARLVPDPVDGLPLITPLL